MLLAEELLLLTLDDETGRRLVPAQAVRSAVLVALVTDLLAGRALALDDAGVLVWGRPDGLAGDPLLERTALTVVGRLPDGLGPGDRRVVWELLSRLRARKVLRRGRLPTRHLPCDPRPEAGVRARLLEGMQAPVRPDRRTALLLSLVYELDLLRHLFPHHARVELATRAVAVRATLRDEAHYFRTTVDQDTHRPSLPEPSARLSGLVDLLTIAARLLD